MQWPLCISGYDAYLYLSNIYTQSTYTYKSKDKHMHIYTCRQGSLVLHLTITLEDQSSCYIISLVTRAEDSTWQFMCVTFCFGVWQGHLQRRRSHRQGRLRPHPRLRVSGLSGVRQLPAAGPFDAAAVCSGSMGFGSSLGSVAHVLRSIGTEGQWEGPEARRRVDPLQSIRAAHVIWPAVTRRDPACDRWITAICKLTTSCSAIIIIYIILDIFYVILKYYNIQTKIWDCYKFRFCLTVTATSFW